MIELRFNIRQTYVSSRSGLVDARGKRLIDGIHLNSGLTGRDSVGSAVQDSIFFIHLHKMS